MLDLSYFQNQNSNVQGFFNGGTWQTWIKPRGAKLVNIICQGSGAGGGGGYYNNATRAGGGGGGTGATARLTVNANLLPDILYILPGIGGGGGLGTQTLGGTIGSTGSSGQNSFVTLIPNTSSVSNVVLRSGITPATGGGGASTNVGSAGAGETISLIANNIFANLGAFTFQAGNNASAGGGTVGGGTTPVNYIVGGTGGGGTSTGGIYAASGVFPAISGAALNTNGQNGIILYKPTLILLGGLGGGGSTTGGGGNGGNGAPGTGGGGGGAGFSAPGGNGGRGGDGFVIITTSL